MRYEVHGAGDPLVLIHGLAGSGAWWARNIPALSRERSVYVLDLPGFGFSRQLRNEFSVAAGHVWLASFLTAVGLERVSLIGHSMGGLIAAMFAARWPEKVDRLVLAAPSIGLSRTSFRSHLLPVMKAGCYTRPQFLPRLLWDTARTGPTTLIRSARELLKFNADHDCHRELRAITAPSLLIWGERDILVPASLAHPVASTIPNSRLHVIPRAGHVVMCERPEDFNNSVLRFLSEKERPGISN